MRRKTIFSIGVFISACIITAAATTRAGQPDCASLETEGKKITNLIKKKSFLENAVEDCPESATLHSQLAFSLERLLKYEEAAKHYSKAASLEPNNAKHHFGVGDVLVMVDNLKGAIAAYEKGLAIDPGNDRAKKQLEVARIKNKSQKGETISAEEIVKVMTETVPPKPAVNDPTKAPLADNTAVPNEVDTKDATQGSNVAQAEAEQKETAPASAGGTEEAAANIAGPLLRMQIPFGVNSTDLEKPAIAMLQTVGTALNHERLKKAKFEIAGHTDDRGADDYNIELSLKRAESVKSFLVQQYKVDPSRLTVVSYGESRPLAPNDTNENRAMNRRVEFRRIN